MAAQQNPVGLETEGIDSDCCAGGADPCQKLSAADFHAGKLVGVQAASP
jgi:hypothetical protein